MTGAPRLHLEVHRGVGPYALLVHGALSSRAQWLPNLEALGSVCRPVVVELFGHGRSPTPDEAAVYTPAAYVAEFERIRQHLDTDRWFLCGQSLGAALTLRYALDRPDRLIAHVFTNSASALADAAWAGRIRPLIEAFARELEAGRRELLDNHPLHPKRGRRLPPEVREALVADVALHDPRGIARTFLHTVLGSALGERLGENRVPTLLVVGRHESDFAPRRRHAEAAMPLLQVVEADAGHAVNAEDSATFNSAAVRFFAEHTLPWSIASAPQRR